MSKSYEYLKKGISIVIRFPSVNFESAYMTRCLVAFKFVIVIGVTVSFLENIRLLKSKVMCKNYE